MSAFLSSPFRVFFFLANTYAVIAIGAWLLFIGGFSVASEISLAWHIREMLFAFVGTVMLGFLLTASANWSGQPALKGNALLFLAIAWIVSRFLWLFSDHFAVAAGLDALVFLGGAIKLGHMLYAASNRRNYAFVLVLLLFSAFCCYEFIHLSATSFPPLSHYQVVMFLMIHVVLVMGGRVIPFFTDRGLVRETTKRYVWLENCSLLSSIAFIGTLLLAVGVGIDRIILQALSALVVIFNLLRWLSWKPWQTRANAMLWPLHLSYLLVCFGFVAYAFDAPSAIVMHIFAIGGFGVIILSMTSRVTLGHTGRPLVIPKGMHFAFYVLLLALFGRVSAVLIPQAYLALISLSGLCWMLAYMLYLRCFAPMLWSERADSKS